MLFPFKAFALKCFTNLLSFHLCYIKTLNENITLINCIEMFDKLAIQNFVNQSS